MIATVTRTLSPRLIAVRAAPSISASGVSRRGVTTLAKSLYTAHASASGQGRNGKTSLLETAHPLELTLAMPKALGGDEKGQNPEQLFAMGYAACFLSALNLVASQAKSSIPKDTKCESHVSIGPPAEGNKPFAISVELVIKASAQGKDLDNLKALVDKAHDVCPYSNATVSLPRDAWTCVSVSQALTDSLFIFSTTVPPAQQCPCRYQGFVCLSICISSQYIHSSLMILERNREAFLDIEIYI